MPSVTSICYMLNWIDAIIRIEYGFSDANRRFGMQRDELAEKFRNPPLGIGSVRLFAESIVKRFGLFCHRRRNPPCFNHPFQKGFLQLAFHRFDYGFLPCVFCVAFRLASEKLLIQPVFQIAVFPLQKSDSVRSGREAGLSRW